MALQALMNIFKSKLARTSIITIHHQYIAKHIAVLVSGLKEFTQKYDSNFSSYNDYQFYGMVWEGLEATPAYQQLNTADKNRIQDTLNAEQYGNDQNGNPKASKGNPSGC